LERINLGLKSLNISLPSGLAAVTSNAEVCKFFNVHCVPHYKNMSGSTPQEVMTNFGHLKDRVGVAVDNCTNSLAYLKRIRNKVRASDTFVSSLSRIASSFLRLNYHSFEMNSERQDYLTIKPKNTFGNSIEEIKRQHEGMREEYIQIEVNYDLWDEMRRRLASCEEVLGGYTQEKLNGFTREFDELYHDSTQLILLPALAIPDATQIGWKILDYIKHTFKQSKDGIQVMMSSLEEIKEDFNQVVAELHRIASTEVAG
jgi:FtsZ-binding cell division protein ZapB